MASRLQDTIGARLSSSSGWQPYTSQLQAPAPNMYFCIRQQKYSQLLEKSKKTLTIHHITKENQIFEKYLAPFAPASKQIFLRGEINLGILSRLTPLNSEKLLC